MHAFIQDSTKLYDNEIPHTKYHPDYGRHLWMAA